MSNPKGIPAELKNIFDQLQQDAVGLHMRWLVFCQLYAKSQERVELLNNTAQLFFAHLQNVLFDDVILGICRLTDPTRAWAKGTRRENLVLKQLIERLDAEDCPNLHQDMLKLYSIIEDGLDPFRQNRNWLIAHRDLQAAVPVNNIVLDITKSMFEQKLEQISDYLNCFEGRFCDCTTSYQGVITSEDGDSLVTALKKGYEYDQMVREGDSSEPTATKPLLESITIPICLIF